MSDTVYGSLRKELNARKQRIKHKTADWKDYHQTGVLLSELAESIRCIRFSGWSSQYVRYLHRALLYFKQATYFVPDSDDLAHHSISCDEVRALVRLAREESTQENMYRAHKLMSTTLDILLSLHGIRPEDNPQAWHQTAIAYSIATQIAWGQRLNYPELVNPANVQHLALLAIHYFRAEAHITPDSERAYRSFMHYMTLGYWVDSHYSSLRKCAQIALLSAIRHNDISHTIRTVMIWAFGQKGECFLRKRRDGRAVFLAP